MKQLHPRLGAGVAFGMFGALQCLCKVGDDMLGFWVLQALLEMVCISHSGQDLQATAAIALGNLARYPANR